jgi:hypothetical protein
MTLSYSVLVHFSTVGMIEDQVFTEFLAGEVWA